MNCLPHESDVEFLARIPVQREQQGENTEGHWGEESVKYPEGKQWITGIDVVVDRVHVRRYVDEDEHKGHAQQDSQVSLQLPLALDQVGVIYSFPELPPAPGRYPTHHVTNQHGEHHGMKRDVPYRVPQGDAENRYTTVVVRLADPAPRSCQSVCRAKERYPVKREMQEENQDEIRHFETGQVFLKYNLCA